MFVIACNGDLDVHVHLALIAMIEHIVLQLGCAAMRRTACVKMRHQHSSDLFNLTT